MDFEGKTIALGICGGIAAYRACDLIRHLQRLGAKRVIPLLSDNAEAFVTPLTLEALSHHPVYSGNLATDREGVPVHIAVAQQADALLILPATANMVAKLANGLADDLVSTTAISFTDKPVVIVPAMNTRMWRHPLTQKNLESLKTLDFVSVVSPISGDLACGETGDGHLAEEADILLALYRATHPNGALYKGVTALVSAGGTREPLDPVRVLTNRSSGKMGIAIADELYAMGASVTLVSTRDDCGGEPLNKPYPVVVAETAMALKEAVESRFDKADVLIMASAVSDFYPAEGASQKIKKNGSAPVSLSLLPSHDILAGIGRIKRPHQVTIGFAAESEALITNALEKLQRKNLDAVVANDISRKDIGFSVDVNEVTILFADGSQQAVPKTTKARVARTLLQALCERLPSLQNNLQKNKTAMASV